MKQILNYWKFFDSEVNFYFLKMLNWVKLTENIEFRFQKRWNYFRIWLDSHYSCHSWIWIHFTVRLNLDMRHICKIYWALGINSCSFHHKHSYGSLIMAMEVKYFNKDWVKFFVWVLKSSKFNNTSTYWIHIIIKTSTKRNITELRISYSNLGCWIS